MMFHLGSIIWIILIGIVIYLLLARQDDQRGCGCKDDYKNEGKKPSNHDQTQKKVEM